jgi:hypothetical protein
LANFSSGGDGCLDCIRSKEAIKKQLETYNRTILSRGYRNSPETLVILRKNIRKATEVARGINSKPVLQYDLEGNFIKEWENSSRPEEALGIDASSILKNCKGRMKSSGGFIWRYKIGKDYPLSITPILRHLTEKQINEIMEMRENGIPALRIAKKCNKHPSTITLLFKRKDKEKEKFLTTVSM